MENKNSENEDEDDSVAVFYSRSCVSFEFFGKKISASKKHEMINRAMAELCDKEYVDEKTGTRMKIGVILSI